MIDNVPASRKQKSICYRRSTKDSMTIMCCSDTYIVESYVERL